MLNYHSGNDNSYRRKLTKDELYSSAYYFYLDYIFHCISDHEKNSKISEEKLKKFLGLSEEISKTFCLYYNRKNIDQGDYRKHLFIDSMFILFNPYQISEDETIFVSYLFSVFQSRENGKFYLNYFIYCIDNLIIDFHRKTKGFSFEKIYIIILFVNKKLRKIFKDEPIITNRNFVNYFLDNSEFLNFLQYLFSAVSPVEGRMILYIRRLLEEEKFNTMDNTYKLFDKKDCFYLMKVFNYLEDQEKNQDEFNFDSSLKEYDSDEDYINSTKDYDLKKIENPNLESEKKLKITGTASRLSLERVNYSFLSYSPVKNLKFKANEIFEMNYKEKASRRLNINKINYYSNSAEKDKLNKSAYNLGGDNSSNLKPKKKIKPYGTFFYELGRMRVNLLSNPKYDGLEEKFKIFKIDKKKIFTVKNPEIYLDAYFTNRHMKILNNKKIDENKVQCYFNNYKSVIFNLQKMEGNDNFKNPENSKYFYTIKVLDKNLAFFRQKFTNKKQPEIKQDPNNYMIYLNSKVSVSNLSENSNNNNITNSRKKSEKKNLMGNPEGENPKLTLMKLIYLEGVDIDAIEFLPKFNILVLGLKNDNQNFYFAFLSISEFQKFIYVLEYNEIFNKNLNEYNSIKNFKFTEGNMDLDYLLNKKNIREEMVKKNEGFLQGKLMNEIYEQLLEFFGWKEIDIQHNDIKNYLNFTFLHSNYVLKFKQLEEKKKIKRSDSV